MLDEETTARIQELGQDVSDLLDAYTDVSPGEVGYRLIATATRFMLLCAPNHLVAMKTVMHSVEIGVCEYQAQVKMKEKTKREK